MIEHAIQKVHSYREGASETDSNHSTGCSTGIVPGWEGGIEHTVADFSFYRLFL